MKMWLAMWAYVILFMLIMTSIVQAEFIYDIEGIFAPTLKNPASVSFRGDFTFPEEDVDVVAASFELDNEFDLNTGEPIPRNVNFELQMNLPGNPLQPYDFRTYFGTFNNEPVNMFLVDYDMEAGLVLDSDLLDDGGGWDAWSVSFVDYQLGSLTSMEKVPQVNEPAGLALLAVGLIFGIGALRPRAQ